MRLCHRWIELELAVFFFFPFSLSFFFPPFFRHLSIKRNAYARVIPITDDQPRWPLERQVERDLRPGRGVPRSRRPSVRRRSCSPGLSGRGRADARRSRWRCPPLPRRCAGQRAGVARERSMMPRSRLAQLRPRRGPRSKRSPHQAQPFFAAASGQHVAHQRAAGPEPPPSDDHHAPLAGAVAQARGPRVLTSKVLYGLGGAVKGATPAER